MIPKAKYFNDKRITAWVYYSFIWSLTKEIMDPRKPRNRYSQIFNLCFVNSGDIYGILSDVCDAFNSRGWDLSWERVKHDGDYPPYEVRFFLGRRHTYLGLIECICRWWPGRKYEKYRSSIDCYNAFI